jgi:preprotein translocase subunit SecB
MIDTTSNGGAQPAPAGERTQAPIQARVVAQYIKDLSFENPNVGKLLAGPGESPNLKLDIDVSAVQMGPDVYESAIDFRAHASNKANDIYLLHVVYAGLFKVENMPADALEPFLLINCPSIVFPFVRRLIGDITREGGFPPLFLDPVDFAQLYLSKRREGGVAATAAGGKPS